MLVEQTIFNDQGQVVAIVCLYCWQINLIELFGNITIENFLDERL